VIQISDTLEKDILEFAKRWMKLLADGQLEEACALLDEPNTYGIVWTAEKIREVVAATFNPGSIFYSLHPEGPVFTDPYQLPEQEYLELMPLPDNDGFEFGYDIPLNGEWSDLTAIFMLYKRPQGYAVVLHDLHVL
jgi:hypothetical protein